MKALLFALLLFSWISRAGVVERIQDHPQYSPAKGLSSKEHPSVKSTREIVESADIPELLELLKKEQLSKQLSFKNSTFAMLMNYASDETLQKLLQNKGGAEAIVIMTNKANEIKWEKRLDKAILHLIKKGAVKELSHLLQIDIFTGVSVVLPAVMKNADDGMLKNISKKIPLLHMSTAMDEPKWVERLIALGVNVNEQSWNYVNDETPLDIALRANAGHLSNNMNMVFLEIEIEMEQEKLKKEELKANYKIVRALWKAGAKTSSMLNETRERTHLAGSTLQENSEKEAPPVNQNSTKYTDTEDFKRTRNAIEAGDIEMVGHFLNGFIDEKAAFYAVMEYAPENMLWILNSRGYFNDFFSREGSDSTLLQQAVHEKNPEWIERLKLFTREIIEEDKTAYILELLEKEKLIAQLSYDNSTFAIVMEHASDPFLQKLLQNKGGAEAIVTLAGKAKNPKWTTRLRRLNAEGSAFNTCNKIFSKP